jgi:hypothetical protein
MVPAMQWRGDGSRQAGEGEKKIPVPCSSDGLRERIGEANALRRSTAMKYGTIRYALLLLGVLLLPAPRAAAQTSGDWSAIASRRSVSSDVDFILTRDGRIGFDTGSFGTGFVAPRGSGHSYLFGAGLWFGAIRQGSQGPQTLVFSTYNPTTGRSNGTPGDTGQDEQITTSSIYHSVDYYRNGDARSGGPGWPLWLVQPSDTLLMMNPGIYVPDPAMRNSGEYNGGAAFVTDIGEQLLTRFHDRNLDRYENGAAAAAEQGFPIGLQIEENIYAWDSGIFRDAVVVQYQVVNISGAPIEHCVIGQVSDPDIDTGDSDHLALYTQNPALRTVMVWKDNPGEFGKLAAILLEAPVCDKDGFVDNRNRGAFRRDGRLGVLSRWSGDNGPMTNQDRYDAMTLPDWSPDGDTGPADQRMVMASNTFSLRPGDTAHFAVAYMVLGSEYGKLRGGDRGEFQSGFPHPSGYMLEYAVGRLIDTYYGYVEPVTSGVRSEAGTGADAVMSAAPNPAGDHATITFSLPEAGGVTVRLIDPLGRTVAVEELRELAAGAHHRAIDLAGLPSGLYLVSLESATGRRMLPLQVMH